MRRWSPHPLDQIARATGHVPRATCHVPRTSGLPPRAAAATLGRPRTMPGMLAGAYCLSVIIISFLRTVIPLRITSQHSFHSLPTSMISLRLQTPSTHPETDTFHGIASLSTHRFTTNPVQTPPQPPTHKPPAVTRLPPSKSPADCHPHPWAMAPPSLISRHPTPSVHLPPHPTIPLLQGP
jgi:hypothetical protein